MDLVHQVAANLEIEPGKAEKGIGVGPAGLLAALAAAGYQKDDIPRLGRLVLEQLRPAIGREKLEEFLRTAPMLQ